MYDARTVLIPSPDLMMRFEPGLNGGTLYLFDIDSGGIFTSGPSTHCFLRLLDGKRTLAQVCDAFLTNQPHAEPTAIAATVTDIAHGLLGWNLVIEAGHA